MKKRFWSFLLTACLVLSLLPIGVFAEDFPSNPVKLPIGGQAYAADGWYRFTPVKDGLYSFALNDPQAKLSFYHTRLGPSGIAHAEQMIADGERQLLEGRTAIETGERQYAAAKASYDDYLAKYESKRSVHEQKRSEYERSLALVNLPIVGEAAREIVTAFEEEDSDLRYMALELEEGKKQLAQAEQMLSNGRAQIAAGEAQLQEARDQIAASRAGRSFSPVLVFSESETELIQRGLFLVNAGSEYLVHVEGGTDPTLSCKFVCNAFEDVDPYELYLYYLNPVYWAAANRITLGTDETHFSPDAPCTRAQVVTFLWRFYGCPKPNASCLFSDVTPDAYYYDAVRWAVSRGITNGTDDTHFSPNASCTRAQVVTFLWRANGEETSSTFHAFNDVSVNSYYFHAVNWALSHGITNGTDSAHFSPENTCTRAQVVTFLYRASR